jgi:hypothetical protein
MSKEMREQMDKFKNLLKEDNSIGNNIQTPEEFWFKNTGQNINQEEYSAMIEFAKFHVEAALKSASEIILRNSGVNDFEDSILNSYPLTNIR